MPFAVISLPEHVADPRSCSSTVRVYRGIRKRYCRALPIHRTVKWYRVSNPELARQPLQAVYIGDNVISVGFAFSQIEVLMPCPFEPDVDTEVHAPAMASSISQTIAFGPRRGQPVQRLRPAVGNCESWSNRFQSEITSPLCARYDGYTVHANRWIPQSDRKGLEKLISYAARGPLSEERLRDLPNGNVEVKLKTPWTNGTTHLIFTHSEFIEKLIALIPPSWFHMVRYFGMFVSNAKFRETILPGFDGKKKMPKQPKKKRSIKWADLLKRVFDIDVTKCQKCGGLLKLIDILMPSPELTQLLRQLHLNPDPPPRLPAKTSHLFDAFFEDEVFCE